MSFACFLWTQSFFSGDISPKLPCGIALCFLSVLFFLETSSFLNRIVKANEDDQARNLSSKQLWTLFFAEGKDDTELLVSNVNQPLKQLLRLVKHVSFFCYIHEASLHDQAKCLAAEIRGKKNPFVAPLRHGHSLCLFPDTK